MKNYYVLTGATSGLGLEAARLIANASSDNVLVVGARRPNTVDKLKAAVPAKQLILEQLDTSSIASVTEFSSSVLARLHKQSIKGLMLNAGRQIVSEKKTSIDGFELTFATNVFGHIALFLQLGDLINTETVVVSTASGTHDPDHVLAKKHGFSGGVFPSALKVSIGDYGRTDLPGAGLDRYSTSKLCNVMFTYGMGDEVGHNGPRFIAFDPGLMPGTELARDRSKAVQFAWKKVLPAALRRSEGVSSAQRSGAVLADLLLGREASDGTGLHIEFTRKPIRSSVLSYSKIKQAELMQFVRDTLAARTTPT